MKSVNSMSTKNLRKFHDVLNIVECNCPSDFGLEEDECTRCNIDCSECWKNAVEKELIKRGEVK